MPEPLKHFFNEKTVANIASMVSAVDGQFRVNEFLHHATIGLDSMEFMDRARHIAKVLRNTIPGSAEHVMQTITAALPPVTPVQENHPFSSFIFLPFSCIISDYGPDHYETAIHACYQITQRFTAEYCLRPLLLRHTERTLRDLETWTADPSHHVRRLVSEGTRPRLPWAPRLPQFQSNPRPVLRLLKELVNDESLYVRRSVANNVNDIAKDNPTDAIQFVASVHNPHNQHSNWIALHALRSLIKRAHPDALAIVGYRQQENILISKVKISPETVAIGESVTIDFDICNQHGSTQNILADIVVHFVKASGATAPKVFKVARASIDAGMSRGFRKTLSLKQHTTRTHFPGIHRVEVQINGERRRLGEFRIADT